MDCGTKDELAIRVAMVKSGKTYLAFTREYHALKNLITAAKTLIQHQKRMYLLDPKIDVKKEDFLLDHRRQLAPHVHEMVHLYFRSK